MTDPDTIIAKLSAMEQERLVEWKGPPGAAYNAISEDSRHAGLLNATYALTPLGVAVRARLIERNMG